MKPKICCMNCNYYFADSRPDKSICLIDNEIIDPEISEIVKCKAFDEWFGSV